MTSISNVNNEIEAINSLIIRFGTFSSLVILIILVIIWFMFQRMKTQVIEEVKTSNQLLINREDREKILKKEVYLDAVSAINSDQLLLSLITNMDIPVKDINMIKQQNSEKIAKAHITGSIETLKHITSLNSEIGKSLIELIPLRVNIDTKKNYELFLSNLLKNINDKQYSIIDQIDSIKNDGQTISKEQFDHFNKTYQEQQDYYESTNKELDALREEILALHQDLLLQSFKHIAKTSKLIPAAVVSVRKELDLEIDHEEYEKIINKGLSILNPFLPEEDKIKL